jgi:hypothetical protein
MLAEYDSAVEYFDAFRKLGFGNVPPDKQVLLALVKHHFPDSPHPIRRSETLKKTLQRERARRRR